MGSGKGQFFGEGQGGNQWDEEGQHARSRAHMPGHFTRVHSFTHQQDMGGRGLLCTGVKEFCVYPTTELGNGEGQVAT